MKIPKVAHAAAIVAFREQYVHGERFRDGFLNRDGRTAFIDRLKVFASALCTSTAKMDEKNHHLHKPVFIGEVKADGQFNVVWKTKGPVKAQPWSPFIAGNDKKKDEPALMAEKK
jgi:hypothetical protein